MPRPASDSSPRSYITGRDSLEPDVEPEETSPVSTIDPLETPGEDPRCIIYLAGPDCVHVALENFEPEEVEIDQAVTEVRWYCVWDIPTRDRHEIAGIHWGRWNDAHASIISLNNEEFQGIRWRRCDSKEDAKAKFLRESSRFGLCDSLAERVIGWVISGP